MADFGIVEAQGASNFRQLPTGQSSWSCSLCGLRSSQVDHASFLRHVQQVHVIEAEEKRSRSNDEYQAWIDGLLTAAFPPNLPQQSLSQTVQNTLASPPLKTNSFGTEEFQKLSIAPLHGEVTEESQSSRGRPALSQTPLTILDDASRIAQASRPSTSSRGSRPLPQGSRQSPVNRHRSIRPLPVTTSAPGDPNFTHYTSQNRPASREVIDPVGEVLREGRRKAPPNSQPSTPPTDSPQQLSRPRHRGVIDATPDSRFPNLILQPDSRGISQEQLATEVRTIYNGLTALETRCIKLDKEQAIASEKGSIPPNTWRALISIHRALLNDHHDFFLASQHPSAAPPLHRLAVKYNMPARMWKHGIHSFLELLRHQLPHSLEFMISFIYLAYQMMSLLLETVPSFEDTWIECLGDLSRYRMAVEEEDPKDRETWSNVARYWYCKAADRMPNTGRLYHHLAILARPNALQQGYLYSRSLISTQPFLSARESVQTLFDPVIRDGAAYLPEVDASFIKAVAHIFYRRFDEIKAPMDKFQQLLELQIGKVTSKWREFGVYIAGTTIGALFDFGNKNTLVRTFELGNYLAKELNVSKDSEALTAMRNPYEPDPQSEQSFEHASVLFFVTLSIILRRPGDRNVHPYLHVVLCFILTLVSFYRARNTFPELQAQLVGFLNRVPWDDICLFLNTLSDSEHFGERFETHDFLRPERGDPGPLPEDYLLRGLIFTQTYYPSDWFNEADLDDERSLEHASTTHRRGERLLWIGYKLSQYGCLVFDASAKTWKPDVTSPCVTFQGTPAGPGKDLSGDTFMYTDSSQLSMNSMEGVQGTTSSINTPLPISVSSGSEKISIAQKFTSIFIHLDVMVQHKDVCSFLINQGWSVIIMGAVWKQLVLLSQSQDNGESRAAKEAVELVKKDCEDHNNFKVVDEEGREITKQAMMDSMHADQSSRLHDDNVNRHIDSMKKTMMLFDKRNNSTSKPPDHGIKTACLLTDDTAVEKEARKVDIYVLATEAIRDSLIHHVDSPSAT